MMPNLTFNVTPFPAGHGAWIRIPGGVKCRITKDLRDGDGERDVLKGLFSFERTILDPETNVKGPTTFRFYTEVDGDWVLDPEDAITIEQEPEFYWNALNEPALYMAARPRDALIVFLSARLAQLTRTPGTQLSNCVHSENHKYRYPIYRGHEFEAPNTPVIGVEYASGGGGPADVGWGLTEHGLQILIEVMGSTIDERDAVTDAIRELAPEIDLFLDRLGCQNTMYGNFKHYPFEDENGNFVYCGKLSISTTAYTFVGRREKTWELAPTWAPVGMPGGDAVIESKDPALSPYPPVKGGK